MVRITISDVKTVVRYELVGSNLRMTETGGCRDALLENGLMVLEGMTDNGLAEAVANAWIIGYAGDPERNELTVHINRE